VVALESQGLASVYIGGIRNQIEAVAQELALPQRVFPVFGLCVGYEDPGQPATVKPRLPQSAVLHRERYQLAEQLLAMRDYDETMRQFYQAQGMRPAQWSQHSVERVASAKALQGRDRLKQALQRLGFEMR
jgi:hypothetical protein